MNGNRLKALAFTVPLCLSLTLATPQAQAIDGNNVTVKIVTPNPRFEHLSRISASLSISSLGRASCGGSFTIYDIYDGYDSRMTMVLEQYVDSDWELVKEWSEDFTGSGIKMMEKGYYVSSGYRYRMTVTAEIFDSKGNVIETVYCDSPIKTY